MHIAYYSVGHYISVTFGLKTVVPQIMKTNGTYILPIH